MVVAKRLAYLELQSIGSLPCDYTTFKDLMIVFLQLMQWIASLCLLPEVKSHITLLLAPRAPLMWQGVGKDVTSTWYNQARKIVQFLPTEECNERLLREAWGWNAQWPLHLGMPNLKLLHKFNYPFSKSYLIWIDFFKIISKIAKIYLKIKKV